VFSGGPRGKWQVLHQRPVKGAGQGELRPEKVR
jgi:hypothetical protein